MSSPPPIVDEALWVFGRVSRSIHAETKEKLIDMAAPRLDVPTRKLAIFDLDGTLIEGHVDRPDPDGPFRQVLPFGVVILLPKVKARLADLLDEGLELAVATNKAGVGFGHQTEAECLEKATNVMAMLGVEGRMRWFECHDHPQAPIARYRSDHPWRKPNPGMLEAAMHAADARPDETFFVGDMDVDREAAERAGCEFYWAKDFFGWG